MEILGQTPVQSILFFVLFGVTGVVPFLAALYLLLRPYNTFSAGIKPPVRLRCRAGHPHSAVGAGERIRQLPHLQPRVPAAHR